jgi:hypothetical protein
MIPAERLETDYGQGIWTGAVTRRSLAWKHGELSQVKPLLLLGFRAMTESFVDSKKHSLPISVAANL